MHDSILQIVPFLKYEVERPSIDEYYIAMAYLAATRATCDRRRVGCILTDANSRVLSVGYNGVPAGMVHCIDEPCEGATAESGEKLDLCMATHAEQSALMSCRDIYSIETAYVTVSPCISCVKLFANTSCKRIVFHENYPHKEAKALWNHMGRIWEQVS